RRALVRGPGDITCFAYAADGAAIIFEMGPARDALQAEQRAEEVRGFAVDDRFEAAFGLRPRDRRLEGERYWSVDVRSGVVRAATDAERRALETSAHGRENLAAPLTPGDDAQAPIQVVRARSES